MKKSIIDTILQDDIHQFFLCRWDIAIFYIAASTVLFYFIAGFIRELGYLPVHGISPFSADVLVAIITTCLYLATAVFKKKYNKKMHSE